MRSLRGLVFVAFGAVVGSAATGDYLEYREAESSKPENRPAVLKEAWREKMSALPAGDFKNCVIDAMVQRTQDYEDNLERITMRKAAFGYSTEDVHSMDRREILNISKSFRHYLNYGDTLSVMTMCGEKEKHTAPATFYKHYEP